MKMVSDVRARSSIFDGTLRALSYDFRVWSNIPGAHVFLRRMLGPFGFESAVEQAPTYSLVLREEGERPFVLLVDGERYQQVAAPGSMIDWLVSEIAEQAIRSTRDYVAVHAGALAAGDAAIALPAPPDSGKTTLVAGLTRVGFSFLSDEAALFDLRSRLVTPFPRPVMMDPSSVAVFPGLAHGLPLEYETFRRERYHLAPDDLRPGSLGRPSPLGFVICPRYDKGAETALTPISKAEGLLELSTNSFNLSRFGRDGLDVLADSVREAECFRLRIGDIESAVRIVSDLVGA